MKLILTDHFKMRFEQRNINYDYVKEAIRNPDFKQHLSGGKIMVCKKLGGQFWEVIYFKKIFIKNKREEYILITVYNKN